MVPGLGGAPGAAGAAYGILGERGNATLPACGGLVIDSFSCQRQIMTKGERCDRSSRGAPEMGDGSWGFHDVSALKCLQHFHHH